MFGMLQLGPAAAACRLQGTRTTALEQDGTMEGSNSAVEDKILEGSGVVQGNVNGNVLAAENSEPVAVRMHVASAPQLKSFLVESLLLPFSVFISTEYAGAASQSRSGTRCSSDTKQYRS